MSSFLSEIIDSLGEDGVEQAYKRFGIQFTGRYPSSNGWLKCKAWQEEHKSDSAGVNLNSGYYNDFRSEFSCSLFDFAAEVAGQFATREDAIAHFAAEVGLSWKPGSKSGSKPKSRTKPRSRSKRPRQVKPTENWDRIALELHTHRNAIAARYRLALDWDADPVVLERLGIGTNSEAWTIPERDGHGRTIGISSRTHYHSERFEPHQKSFFTGGRRGLIYDPDSALAADILLIRAEFPELHVDDLQWME